ncbi:hypothetical protein [Caballeronia sp. dw_19]|uniref:hypothetical protein n=1 Tax=Caballeronia sp. dw_19 TaxID=2719791 RepID=UPI001BD4A8EA|nr:hypothetical protein [Caballeronia sp. dw_19]
MHRALVYVAFGWLTFGGMMHFLIDVISQYVRGKRAPGPETTLYYGLNTSFALGQVAFGLICLWLAWHAPAILDGRPVMALAFVAAAAWLAITSLFMGYWEPKLNTGIFAVLLIAAALTI